MECFQGRTEIGKHLLLIGSGRDLQQVDSDMTIHGNTCLPIV